MTKEEKAAYALIAQDIEKSEQQAAEQLEARKAPLRRIGLTDDEINTVLGIQ